MDLRPSWPWPTKAPWRASYCSFATHFGDGVFMDGETGFQCGKKKVPSLLTAALAAQVGQGEPWRSRVLSPAAVGKGWESLLDLADQFQKISDIFQVISASAMTNIIIYNFIIIFFQSSKHKNGARRRGYCKAPLATTFVTLEYREL